MSNYRRARINDEFLHAVADALRQVKDPRVAGEMITITGVDVSGDLKFAKVYFSAYGADDQRIKEIRHGLKSATGVIRHEIAIHLNLRITPEITFIHDDAIERGAHIFDLLKKNSDELEQRADALPSEDEDAAE